MYKVSSLKILKKYSMIIAIGLFLAFLATSECVNEMKHNSSYYWSDSVREGVILLTSLEVIWAIGFMVMSIICIFIFYLEKNGKVCPTCGLVYTQSTPTCLKCKSDITYAKSVEEYRKTAEPKPTVKIDDSQTIVQESVPNTEKKKFCTSCGQKIEENAHYCPRCGTKIQ